MNKLYKNLCYKLILICVFGCLVVLETNGQQDIENLTSFAKLYGYIKYFHPSDESSSIDWDKFSVLGVNKIKNVKNDSELLYALKELFTPIAPTLQIFKLDEEHVSLKSIYPEDTTGLKIVSWQHLGVKSSSRQTIYKSVRTNKYHNIKGTKTEPSFGTITQVIDALKYRGKEIKLQAAVKANVTGNNNQGQLWLRVDRISKEKGFFDNMYDRPITSTGWQRYTIVGKVDEDAERIVFGAFLKGEGKVWVDDFNLFYKNELGKWAKIDINDSGFEEESLNSKEENTWKTGSYNYSYELVDSAYHGKRSLLIKREYVEREQLLFDQYPKVGEIVKKQIADSIFCTIPIALYTDSVATLGKNENYPLHYLMNQLDEINIDKKTVSDENIRLADVVIAWNVFQHFYPYFNVIDVDWIKVLSETLQDAVEDTSADDFYNTLSKMVAKLQDGHGYLYYKRENKVGGLPLRVEWIEDQCIITASEDSLFQKGDMIKRIDGIEVENYLLKREDYISGSTQLKRYRALNQFGSGEVGSIASLDITRNDSLKNIKLVRGKEKRGFFFNPITEFNYLGMKEIEEGIFYINLHQIGEKDFYDNLDKLATAKGVIFDWRLTGEFNKNKRFNSHEILPYLTTSKLQSARWNIPETIYPDRQNVEFLESRSVVYPASPKFNSKVIFIVDPSVVSYGETVMGTVEYYKLADIIGQRTAGCNGNVNYIPLIGSYEIMWTGMKVLKHDGSQHHLIGIEPDYPVERTIKAVKEGRDEYLEKALEVIRGNIK